MSKKVISPRSGQGRVYDHRCPSRLAWSTGHCVCRLAVYILYYILLLSPLTLILLWYVPFCCFIIIWIISVFLPSRFNALLFYIYYRQCITVATHFSLSIVFLKFVHFLRPQIHSPLSLHYCINRLPATAREWAIRQYLTTLLYVRPICTYLHWFKLYLYNK